MVEYNIAKACATGDIEYVKKCLLDGMNPNATCGNNGWTPLILAIEHRQIEIIKFLLKNGADINFQVNGGWSALHHAVDSEIDGTLQTCCGNLEKTPIDLVMLLLENGADVDLKLDDGDTPIDIAKDYKYEKFITLLQKYSKKL